MLTFVKITDNKQYAAWKFSVLDINLMNSHHGDAMMFQ